MKNKIYSLLARMTTVTMLVTSVFNFAPVHASSMTVLSDTMTRLQISTASSHSIIVTLPTGIDFDITDDTDVLEVDFPVGFTQSGTWVVGDFTFNDGTLRPILTVTAASSPSADCTGTAGVNDVAVTIDTDDFTFGFTPCGTFTASATAATVTIGILGGNGSDGVFTNPSSAGSKTVNLSMDDDGTANAHVGDTQIAIVDSDQVTVTATVVPSITFDIDTATTDIDSNAPYSVSLGNITTGDSRVSGTTDTVNYIWIDLDTNATGGAVVTVQNANGADGMESTSVSTDDIDSAAGTIANGTENYGICVAAVTETTGALEKSGDFTSGTCTADLQTPAVHDLTTAAANILDTTSAPISAGRAQITVAAAISALTDAHDDYTDTLTFIATGTF